MIDIANIERPDILDMPTYEALVTENTELLKQLVPDYQPLESDPYQLLIEAFSYRELHLRTQFNNRLTRLLLVYASGNDLDVIAASYYGLERLKDEEDKPFKLRILGSLDGYSTAGSIESYEFHASSVSAVIEDVLVFSPEKGVVKIVLASFNDEITPALIAQVEEKVNATKVRPVTDEVLVEIAAEKVVIIDADIVTFNIDDEADIRSTVIDNFSSQLSIGEDLTYSQMIKNCHTEGVYKVTLTNHGADIICNETQIIKISEINLTFSKFEA